MKKRFELDFLGQYYAGTINEKQTGVFSIAVHLKENLNHKILKQALADLAERFPFLCGCLRSNFFWYEYEITNDTLPLIPIEKTSDPTSSGQIFRVLYGERHFMIEVNHLLCDGRTLSKIARALLIRYFKILGINSGDSDTTIFNESQHSEELENAYLRFANTKIKKADNVQRGTLAYHPPTSKTASIKTLTYQLSASKVKAMAKTHQVTVSEFLLSLIFKSIAVERAVFKRKEPIIASIPIDCRRFFPSKTMRNFVSAQYITMPEVEDLTIMTKQIQKAFTKIDKLSVLEDLSSFQKMYQPTRYLPRKLKDWYMKRVQTLESTKHTTGFSNVGKVDFPETILNRINFMEFFISLDEETPYYFSCVTVGNILTLTVTLKVDINVLVEELEDNLNQFLVAER